MASFCSLPLDLVASVTGFLKDDADLASCRLVSKLLCAAASASARSLTVKHLKLRKLPAAKLSECFPLLEELIVKDASIVRTRPCSTVWQLPSSLHLLGLHLPSSHFCDDCFVLPPECTVVLDCAVFHLTGKMSGSLRHLRALQLCPAEAPRLCQYTQLESLYLHVSEEDTAVLECLPHLLQMHYLTLLCESRGFGEFSVESVGSVLARAKLPSLCHLSLTGLEGGSLHDFSHLTTLADLHISCDHACTGASALAVLPLKSLYITELREDLLEACNVHTLVEVYYNVPDLRFFEVFDLATIEDSTIQAISAPLRVGAWVTGANWPESLLPATDVRFGGMPQWVGSVTECYNTYGPVLVLERISEEEEGGEDDDEYVPPEPLFTLRTRSLDDVNCCPDCELRCWQREARRDVRIEIVDHEDLLDAPSFSASCGSQLWEYYAARPERLSRLYCRWV